MQVLGKGRKVSLVWLGTLVEAGRIWRRQVGLRRARMAGTSMALKAARRASAVGVGGFGAWLLILGTAVCERRSFPQWVGGRL